MSSIQERLQLKRVPLDTWNVREQLCLASAVVRSGDQNWMTVSRALKTVGETNRPPDWYSQKSCAAQYGALLEHVETPKRKKRNSEGGVETPQESILKQLTQQRIQEIQNTITDMNSQYEQLKNEINEVRNTSTSEDRIQELWSGIEGAKRARERENARRAAWLKEREERRARAERTWRPQTTSPAASPAPPSSPLLTSLLKSSPVVTTPQHIPHPASLVDTVSPSAGAPTLSSLLEAPDPQRAAIEHIKSQLVQIEHQLQAVSQPSVATVDIDDIEIKAEDVYAFRDIDIHIPPVSAMHKGVRVIEKPKKETEAPPEVQVAEIPEPMDIEEETPPQEVIPEERHTEVKMPEEMQLEEIQEKKEEKELEREDIKISFPEVKFPTPEIKVIQDEQKIKEEIKEPEIINEQEKLEDNLQEDIKKVEEIKIQEEPPQETTTEVVEPKIVVSVEPTVEQQVEQPVEQPIEQPVEPQVEPPVEQQEQNVTNPQDIPLPPEEIKEEVREDEPQPDPEPEPQKTEEKKQEEVTEPKEAEVQEATEDTKKEDDEVTNDSIPLKAMIKEEVQEEMKSETVEEDTHTETDDDTPMELSREEEKDGKKRRDYSRKKKSDSRTCSGSESAPDSPSASDQERQHRLWRKSVMLVYSRLCAHKYASLFVRAITDEEAPGYSAAVRRPMDLTAIRRNIDGGHIRTTAEFQRDVLLMLSNALLYNSSSHSVYTMAKEMHQEAQCQLGMLVAAQAHAGLAPPPARRRRLHAPAGKRHAHT